MIRTTPFHERLAPLNATGLWTHWSGYLVSVKYQMAQKAEYFAVRNAVGLIDTSPLFKYRITGPDAERLLAGALVRDVRTCSPGSAQYTAWCDDAGHVVEDGVVVRHADDHFVLTSAEPNLAWFDSLRGRLRVSIEDVSEQYGVLAVQGPSSRALLARVAPAAAGLGYFQHVATTIGAVPVTVSRTGYTGDLGYEVWVAAGDAAAVLDAVLDAGSGLGTVPVGQHALLTLRIEAGLLLLGVDFRSSRFAFTDEERSTPSELGLGWMLGDLATTERAFVGRDALRRELAGGTSRWATVGVVVDWRDWDRHHHEAGLIPPKDTDSVVGEMMLYEADGTWAGFTTSFVYSPVLQRHVAIARVRPHLSRPGTAVHLEVTIDHRHRSVAAEVARPPLFRPTRKTAPA